MILYETPSYTNNSPKFSFTYPVLVLYLPRTCSLLTPYLFFTYPVPVLFLYVQPGTWYNIHDIFQL